MLFNSYDFMVFFPIVILIYFVIPKRLRYIWLLVASYYFYMGWNAKYAWLLATSTVVTWISGLMIDWAGAKESARTTLIKKIIVATSFAINLGILGFYKYFDFAVANLNAIFSHLHISLIENKFDVLLPVGISFYVFQALSYTVDVYRGEVKAEKNPLRYALFVSFFPQLVAGPIERSKNLLNQVKNVEKIKLFNVERVFSGMILMLWGYFMKMMIADRASVLVDTVFDSYDKYGSVQLILASALFAIQIYGDFGGYSLIAIGAAKIMGFTLMENFNTPYFALSIKDFWRRWHISLSTWFRDYLYIPLGGNRKGVLRKHINLMLTFLVSGLWHGASWHYVVWGGLHGLYQIVESLAAPLVCRYKKVFGDRSNLFSYKLGQMLRTFILADIAWIFFRADSLYAGVSIIKNIFVKWNPWTILDESIFTLGLDVREFQILIVAMILMLLVDLSRYITGKQLDEVLMKQCLWFRWAIVFVLFFMLLTFGIYGPEYQAGNFIYFQF